MWRDDDERGRAKGRGYSAARWAAAAAATALVAIWGCDSGPLDPTDPPSPGISLDMELSELRVLVEPDQVRAFEIRGVDGPQEYVVVVQSTSTTVGTTPVRVTVRTGQGGSAALRPSPSLGAVAGKLSLEDRRTLGEARLKHQMRRELQRVSPRPVRPGEGVPLQTSSADASPSSSFAAGVAASTSATGLGGVTAALGNDQGVPQVGDTLRFTMAVQEDLSVDCEDTTSVITAIVRDVGDGFALVEDTAVAGNFSAADYGELNQELDDIVYPTNTAYWGTPADIDGNERVIVLFTAEVNKLTEAGSPTFIAGFFWAGDLASQEDCPASNRGEIVYLLAPDPDGEFGDPVPVDRAKRNARGVTAHEFQHLLTAQQRVTKGGGTFNDLEDTWLSEGFAHIAEEVAGLQSAGLGLRDDIGFSEITQDAAAFNAYQLSNFARLGHFFLSPSTTPAVSVQDPGGFPSLRMRGFAWIFLRWMADQYAPATPEGVVPGAGEEALFLELSVGAPGSPAGRGTENVERALSAVTPHDLSWAELLGLFSSMPALTDRDIAGLPPETQVSTWDLRDVYQGLNASNLGGQQPFTSPYPLQLTEVDMDGADRTVDFELDGSAQRYFLLRSAGPASDLVVEVGTQNGSALPAGVGAQVTVVRAQ